MGVHWNDQEWADNQEWFPKYVIEAKGYWGLYSNNEVVDGEGFDKWLEAFKKTCDEDFVNNCPPREMFFSQFSTNGTDFTERDFLVMNVQIMKRR